MQSTPNTKVAVIMHGRYSEMKVVGVVTLDKIPDVEELQRNEMHFQVMSLNEYTPIPDGWRPYYITMARDGQVEQVYEDNLSTYFDRNNTSGYITWEQHERFSRCVLATSEKHAVKIVNEERAQRLAAYGSLVAPEHNVNPTDAALDKYGKNQWG
jgi:hypothetical protein